MMKKRMLLFFTMAAVLLFIVGCGAVEEEPEKTAVEEEETNERIIAATYAITEFMDVLNIDLVGVPSSYKELPKRYEGVTEVGNPMWPDMEIVMSLKPTNVLTVTTLKADLEEDFNKIKAPATFLDLTTVSSMLGEIEKIGEQYNRVNEAEKFVADYQVKMAEIEATIDQNKQPKVLILMGIPGSYIVGTEHSYIGDLVKRAGGINAVTGRDEEFISGNTEYLQQLAPDIILRAAHGAPQEVVKMFDKEFAENDIWKHFKAVKDDRVYDLEETRFGTTANLAAVDALEELVDILQK